MRIFIKKLLILLIPLYFVIVGTNYFIDPANLFHKSMYSEMADLLKKGEIIYNPGDMDEGLFQKEVVVSLRYSPNVVIVGSSRVMYADWKYENMYVAALSGAYIGDYYSLIGLICGNNLAPQKVIIGVDPWIFIEGPYYARHKSICAYGEKLRDEISSYKVRKHVNLYRSNLLEIFSLSYFQYSANNWEKIKYRLGVDNIEVAKDDSIESRSKILPNGRRIFSSKGVYSIRDNEAGVRRLISNKNIYQLKDGLNKFNNECLKELTVLVEYLRTRGVEVEIFLHPWYPQLYKYFKSDKRFVWIIELEKQIREYSKNSGIVVHGSFSPEACEINEGDFADWLHLKSIPALKSYNKILVDGDSVSNYCW